MDRYQIVIIGYYSDYFLLHCQRRFHQYPCTSGLLNRLFADKSRIDLGAGSLHTKTQSVIRS